MRIRVEAWTAFGYVHWAAVLQPETDPERTETLRISGSYEEADAPTYEDELWYLADQLQRALEVVSVRGSVS